jgi:hypothetical protein
MPVWHGEARVKNCERMVAVATAIPSGKSASADGMKWDLYPQNLMSEYHIRYGGYGGIGYYLVADSYMGLHKGRCDKTQQEGFAFRIISAFDSCHADSTSLRKLESWLGTEIRRERRTAKDFAGVALNERRRAARN